MATTKRQVECPCGGDYYEKSWDWSDDDKPVWRCANCGRQTNRIKRSRGKKKVTGWKALIYGWQSR